MLARTPDPTPQQVLDALPLCSVRAGRIQQELIERLRAALPGAIDAFNQREGYVGKAKVKQPADFAPAPGVLSDETVPC